MSDSSDVLYEGLDDAIAYARTGERLLSAAGALTAASDAINRVVQLDPLLVPEMRDATEHLDEAAGAIKRGFDSVEARHAAKWGRRE